MGEGQAEPAQLANVARQAAEAGAAELMAMRGRFEVHVKGHRDYVTDADVASQAAIRRVIEGRFPDHAFIGEESPTDRHKPPADGAVCWVVDPLDGTTNYLHDFPCFAVSIAAVLDGNPVAAAVFDPVRDEHFWAALGGGAWLGDRKIQASGVAEFADALLAISLPASVNPDSPDLSDFVRVAPRCQAVRRIGSAALNLAYVACGRLDAYWAREIHPWDVAAGVLLVREAGGVVTGPTGGDFNLWRPPVVASCGPELHGQLVAQLAETAQKPG